MKTIALIVNNIKEEAKKPLLDSIVAQKSKDFTTYSFKKMDIETVLLDGFDGENERNNINSAVATIKEPYFIVVSGDESLNTMYIKNLVDYINAYPEVASFLPTTIHMNENNEFQKFSNEFIWTKSIPKKSGFADFELLKNFPFVTFNGAVIKKDAFIDCGLLKPSFEKYYWYEFFLRLSHKGYDIMVIPRYSFAVVTKLSSDDMLEDKFWFELSKKEYFFNKDRNIKYVPENTTYTK